ncbi:hypothetical protein ON010_g18398 [Phytophthora cinnamomi]|nr:hypothetical protein ON010_g18398 [Phytophthora cinnamomi]
MLKRTDFATSTVELDNVRSKVARSAHMLRVCVPLMVEAPSAPIVAASSRRLRRASALNTVEVPSVNMKGVRRGSCQRDGVATMEVLLPARTPGVPRWRTTKTFALRMAGRGSARMKDVTKMSSPRDCATRTVEAPGAPSQDVRATPRLTASAWCMFKVPAEKNALIEPKLPGLIAFQFCSATKKLLASLGTKLSYGWPRVVCRLAVCDAARLSLPKNLVGAQADGRLPGGAGALALGSKVREDGVTVVTYKRRVGQPVGASLPTA